MKPRYKIVQTPRFERNFRKLSSESRRRVAEKILLLETDPAAGKLSSRRAERSVLAKSG